MMNGDEIQTPILPIDMRNKLADLPLQLGRIRQRRRRHLDHDHIPDPLWVVLQELLKRAELFACESEPEAMVIFNLFAMRGKRHTFWNTPLTTSSLSRPTMIFLPS
jgi:hypothetical protein